MSLTPRRMFFLFALTAPPVVLALSFVVWAPAAWALVPVGLVVVVGLRDAFQPQHSILRQYPVLGHGRFLAERIRPEIQQYFVESETNGTPFSREVRAIVYQRAKGERDKLPFGTQQDVYEPGHEFLAHSMQPAAKSDISRVMVGGPECTQPYEASFLNVSGMSFGALSRQAVQALGLGAARSGFAVNTGEGGITPHHLDTGADLIWQIGTGYFGCRTAAGDFDPNQFSTKAAHPNVKAIEIKLSQGAKPGHGGILPGAKVTTEIAEIRGVKAGTTVLSPPSHTAFTGPEGLLDFVRLLRNLSDGKPIGFKLCVGNPAEFTRLAQAMAETGIVPDFITVDGSEGGTGAAPPELSDSVGMPLREGLTCVHHALIETGVRDRVRLVAAGKVATGFDMIRCVALGADLCYSARAMMLALGCIQARRCHHNDCPAGVATQDPARAAALVVNDKAPRVARFHDETVAAFLELVAAAGCSTPADIGPEHVQRRVDRTTIRSFAEIYGNARADAAAQMGRSPVARRVEPSSV